MPINGKGGTKDIQDDVPSVREHCGLRNVSFEPSSFFFLFIRLLRDLLTTDEESRRSDRSPNLCDRQFVRKGKTKKIQNVHLEPF